MPGRNRQPTDLLLVKGKKHLTKEEIENRKANEVKAPADDVRAPSYLPAKLKKEFERIASQLIDIGIMTNLDCDSLASFLMAREMYVKITKNLLKMKPVAEMMEVYRDKNGEPQQRKVLVDNEAYGEVLKNQDRLFKQCRAAASDLGLSISSRCKLVIPKKQDDDEPKSKWAKFS